MSTKPEGKEADKKGDKKKGVAELLAEEDLSEEDQALKEKLELCVKRLSDKEAGLR